LNEIVLGLLKVSSRYKTISLASVLSSASILLTAVLFIQHKYDSAALISITRLIGIGLSIGFLILYGKPFRQLKVFSRVESNGLKLKEIISVGGSYLTTIIFGITSTQVGILLLGLIKGPNEAYEFAPVVRLVGTVEQLFFLIAGYVLTALIFSSKHESKKELRNLYLICTKLGGIIALPILLSFEFDPGLFLRLFFNITNTNSIFALRILSIGVIGGIIAGYDGILTIALDQHARLRKISLLSLVVVMLLSLILIPIFGIVGAAIATLASVVVYNLALSICLKIKDNQLVISFQYIVIVVLVAGITYFSVVICNLLSVRNWVECFTIISISLLASVCSTALFGGFGKAKEIFSKNL
jgi:O-antigen/teichoic acid export membrane protein